MISTLAAITNEVRRKQPVRLRMLSHEQAERIIGIAIDELPAKYDRKSLYWLKGRTKRIYGERYGFDVLVMVFIAKLVLLLIEWLLISRDHRIDAAVLKEERRRERLGKRD